MKGNRIVESLCLVDFSGLAFPVVTVYERPLDFPDAFVARVWDGKGTRLTNVMIKKINGSGGQRKHQDSRVHRKVCPGRR